MPPFHPVRRKGFKHYLVLGLVVMAAVGCVVNYQNLRKKDQPASPLPSSSSPPPSPLSPSPLTSSSSSSSAENDSDGGEGVDTQLFIIWPGAMKVRDKILTDVKKKFKIIGVVEWEPNRQYFKEDLWRLYWGKGGLSKKGMDTKVGQCGGFGKSTIILVIDEAPLYKEVETAHGVDLVNSNMHKAKYLYRKWSGGGYKVHGTYTKVESEHDYFILFGLRASSLTVPPSLLHQGSTFGFFSFPSCDSVYTAISLTAGPTSHPSPSVGVCKSKVAAVQPFTLSVPLPTDYDKSVNIESAILAAVHAKKMGNDEGWFVTIIGSDLKIAFEISSCITMEGHMPRMHGFHSTGSSSAISKSDGNLDRTAKSLFSSLGGKYFFGEDEKGDSTYDYGGLTTPESELIPNFAARLKIPGQRRKK